MRRAYPLAGAMAAGLLLLARTSASGVEVDFYRDLYPVLKANCISCHNKTTAKGELNMESPELLRKGGESGPGVIPGKSAESLVVQAALHQDDYVMPPKNNKAGAVDLKPAEIALLKAWIDQGAKDSKQQAREVKWQPLPPGVNPIYTVAMTKDGRFAACGRANQIFIYDLATRQLITRAAAEGGTAHRALVQSLAFSPDGTRLASGSFREVKVWKQQRAPAVVRKSEVAAVVSVLSPDGKQIVSADKEGALHLINADTGKATKSIPAVNESGIKLLSVARDASAAAVYGADGALSVWSLREGKRLSEEANVPGVRAIAWTSDGAALVTASDDNIVRVWSVAATEDGKFPPAKALKPGAAGVGAIAATPKADEILIARHDGAIRLWSLERDAAVREFKSPSVTALAVSPDSKRFAAAAVDGAVRMWDLETGAAAGELRGDLETSRRIAALEWTNAEQGLELTFHTREVARLEAQNKAVEELLTKAKATIVDVKKALPEKQKAAQTATEQKLAAQKEAEAAAVAAEGKNDPALEKLSKDAQMKLTTAATAETSALAAARAAEHNISDAEADVERITATKTQNANAIAVANAQIAKAKEAQAKAAADIAAAKQALAKTPVPAVALAFSADGQSLAALGNDGAQRVWAIASGLPIEQGASVGATTGGAISATPEGGFLACTAEGTVMTLSPAPKWVLERVLGAGKDNALFADRVNAVRFSPDGKTLAAGGGEPSRSGDVTLWEVASGKPIANWTERHADAVLSLDFSPDGKLLASGAADKLARVTEIVTGKQAALFEGHTHHVMGVAFRSDGRVLATAGADGVVLVWDMIMGERKKKIEGWAKEVTSLQFIGATPHIVTSAGDNRIRVVNDDGAEIRGITKLPEFMQAAASTPSGNVLIGGGEDSVLRVWDGTNGKELAVFDAR